MKFYLTEQQFNGLRERVKEGASSVTISRSLARQFFLRVSNKSIAETTGESLRWQKLGIWTGTVAAPALLALCVLCVIYYFEWFATLGVPLVGMLWTVVGGLTGYRGSWKHTLIGLVAGLVLAAVLERAYGIPLALFTLSLAIHRTTYQVAGIWLTQLIGRSFGAYDMLVEHIDVDDAELETARRHATG